MPGPDVTRHVTSLLCTIYSVGAIIHEALDQVKTPYNLSVSAISGSWVRISWLYATVPIIPSEDYVRRFDVTLTNKLPIQLGIYKVVRGVDGRLRQCIIDGLSEYKQYSVYMVAVDHSGVASNRSNTVTFSTVTDYQYETRYRPTYLQPGELALLLCVVVAWVIAVVVFLRRWDSIRILQPMEPRYRHTPKNLENVVVVKKPQDSVIYKNYSRKLSVTLIEREKRRLQRMNTMPVLPTQEKVTLEDV